MKSAILYQKNKLNQEYQNFIESQFNEEYFQELISFLKNEKNNHKIIYPSENSLFQSFEKTPFNKMKVVIFGQDPYHSENVSDGLAFSTKAQKTPKSLANIFKELKNEYSEIVIKSNNLESWAEQGVLLLNTSLTVEKNKPNSHQNIGWQNFIKNFIEFLNQNKKFLIFVLWGNNAKKLKNYISNNFIILESPHPSPFSAHRGFFNNNHFRQINEILSENKFKEINWNINDIE